MAVKNLVRTDFRDLLPLGWRDLADALIVRSALESATDGDTRPLANLRAEGRVMAVPDLAEVEVVMKFAGVALLAFSGPEGDRVEAWTARAAVEPWEAEERPLEGNPHRGTTTRPRSPRY